MLHQNWKMNPKRTALCQDVIESKKIQKTDPEEVVKSTKQQGLSLIGKKMYGSLV